MSKHQTDRADGRSTSAGPSDVHDIRALTATGAITLPHLRPHPNTDDGQGRK